MKSTPSLASDEAVAVTKTMESPQRTVTAPPACLASQPVSIITSFPPISAETRWVLLIECTPSFFQLRFGPVGLKDFQRKESKRSREVSKDLQDPVGSLE